MRNNDRVVLIVLVVPPAFVVLAVYAVLLFFVVLPVFAILPVSNPLAAFISLSVFRSLAALGLPALTFQWIRAWQPSRSLGNGHAA